MAFADVEVGGMYSDHIVSGELLEPAQGQLQVPR